MALVTCPRCSASVSDQAAVCPECGFETGARPVPRTSRKSAWLVGCLVLVLLGACSLPVAIFAIKLTWPDVRNQFDGGLQNLQEETKKVQEAD